MEDKLMVGIFVASKSQKMKSVYTVADKVAATGLNVLIQGEPGCGKNTLAEYIHSISGRKGKCCRLNPVSFGGMEADFEKNIKKCFSEAKGGTLLIDDVSYCSLRLQDCILKVWREEEELSDTNSGMRLIGITTRDLQALAVQRRFRRSLADRFVVPIAIPPLRERKDDISVFVDIFASESSMVPTVSKDATDILNSYNWPGNVRELENVFKYAILQAGGCEITPAHLPGKMRRKNASAAKATVSDELYKLAMGLIESGVHSQETNPYEEYLKLIETPLIKAAMDHAEGNKSGAAKFLKINRNTISKKIKDYDIE